MSNRIELLTPVGRLVGGSLYDGQTTNAEGQPLTIRHGVNAGQPRKEYFFALAVPKASETHWSQTEWGVKIWKAGNDGFPNGAFKSPTFAWKVQDGDSVTPNRAGRRNCDREGYPGNWILHFNSGFASSIYNEDGTRQIAEENAVNLGDYIQVYGNVSDNGSQQQPGIYLNHQMVAFRGYGQRIILGVDPKSVGFGKAPLPSGATSIPQGHTFNPPITDLTKEQEADLIPISPYNEILDPPKTKIMLPLAKGIPYEKYIAQGWTDELLIQHGYMRA